MMRIDLHGKAFGEAHVLGRLHIEIDDTESVALIGPSGVGKSTLLRLIAGLDQNFDGSITGVGRLAFVFQEPTLLPWRSARDNIMLAANVSEAEADHLLEQVGLAEKATLYPSQLSLGQRRRIGIVRAFARQPETLLMDEPFASLDPETAASMRTMLSELLRQRPTRLILVSHDAEDVEALATRTIRLVGTPAQIAAN